MCVCLNFLLTRNTAKNPKKFPFSYSACIPILLAFLFSATGCAQLSYFGSGSRLWGQRLGIGGEHQVTFSNSDDGPALIPTPSPPPSPPFPGFYLRNKEGKKTAIWRKPAAASADSGWGLGVYSICSLCYAFTLLLPLPVPWIKWRVFLGSFVTENSLEICNFSVFGWVWVRQNRLKLLQGPKKKMVFLPSHSFLFENAYLMSETVIEAYHILFLIIKTILPSRYCLHFITEKYDVQD